MTTALVQMSLLILCGTVWKILAPKHISALAHRRALTDLVFFILLPAMVVNVIWQAPLNASTVYISLLATMGVLVGLTTMWLISRFMVLNKAQTGTLLLAAAFPNATYLGLPLLDQILGPQTRAIVLQYDLLACTPILMSLGMLLAGYYGQNQQQTTPMLKQIVKIPPLWAVVIGIVLNISQVPQPSSLAASLSLLSGGVVPLMLIVLGMSIPWRSLHLYYLKLLFPVMLISLFIVPLSLYTASRLIGLDAELITSLTLISAMPTMIFGIVICERYQMDSELYAAAVSLTTLNALLTLPLWFYFLA